MSKTSSLIKNTIIIALGKISTQFISFLLLPLYTAYLAAGEFGVVDLITVIVSLTAPIIMLSLEMAVFRFLIDGRGVKERQASVITNSLQMVVYSTLTASLVYVVVMQFVVIPYAWLALCSVLASIGSNYCLQVARGFGDNVKYAIGSVIAGVSAILLNILFITICKMGATGMLLATVISNMLSALYLTYSLKIQKYINIKLINADKKRELLQYSLPLIPNGVSWWIVNAADRMIIAAMLGVTANGIYAVAYKFPQIFTAIYSFFGLSWAESASVHIKSADRDAFFSKVANMSLRVFGSFGAILIVGVSVFFNILINAKYSEARLYVPLLIVGSLFNSIVGIYSAIYIAKKETRQVLNTSMVAAIISILLSVVLTPFIGLYGPAIALIAAYLGMAVFRHFDVKKSIKITYEPKAIIEITVLYIICIGLYYANSAYATAANVVLIGAGVVFINKNTLKIAKDTILKKMRGLKQKQADKLIQEWDSENGAD